MINSLGFGVGILVAALLAVIDLFKDRKGDEDDRKGM